MSSRRPLAGGATSPGGFGIPLTLELRLRAIRSRRLASRLSVASAAGLWLVGVGALALIAAGLLTAR